MIIQSDKQQVIYQDMHMHTCFCDGEDDPEQMIISAIEKCLNTIGICIHSYIDGDLQDYVSLESEKQFCEKMEILKEKYKDKIKVLCGIELDYCTNQIVGKFDYIIGSMHYFESPKGYYLIDTTKEDLIIAVKELFDGDYYKMAERYFELISKIVEKTNCDIIGHFDLITKYNEGDNLFDTKHPRYICAYKKAIDKLVKYNRPFEINTGAISRGYRTQPYPSFQIIEYIKEKGGKLILSSDSHSKENVAFGYDEWKKFL